MPQHTWQTGETIAASLLNDLESRASAALPAASAATVATTGAYSSLTGKPTIPSKASDVGAAPGGPWQFRPEDYYAGGTDDQVAINGAITAAVAYAVSSGTFYAQVCFQPKVYNLTGATIKGPYGNAQIPLPYVAPTGQKIVLELVGAGDASAGPHWLQATPQKAGTVLRSTLTGQANDGTYGAPSVLGAPALANTPNSNFSNLLLVCRGITIVVPPNPTLSAFDLRGLAQANVPNGAVLAEASPSGSPDFTSTPTTETVGLYMPSGNNNDNCNIGIFTVYGYKYAYGFADHVTAQRLAAIYCGIAFFIIQAPTYTHGIGILYASVEATPTVIMSGMDPGAEMPISIVRLDVETGGGTTVNDPNNTLVGTISYAYNLAGNPPTTTGGTKLRIIDEHTKPGVQTAPSIPATTVALKNPFWRDCAVTITGGTVTAIAVDGTALGVTSGTVFVPSGKNITLTYSAAPTWKWIAL